MKALCVISLLFGIAILIVFGAGIADELDRGTLLVHDEGKYIAAGFFLAGFSVTWFSGRTWKTADHYSSAGPTRLLDAPLEIVPASSKQPLSVFTFLCGILGMATALAVCAGAVYGIMSRFLNSGFSNEDLFILFPILLAAACTLTYVIRRLFRF
jgi:hypothetical protein